MCGSTSGTTGGAGRGAALGEGRFAGAARRIRAAFLAGRRVFFAGRRAAFFAVRRAVFFFAVRFRPADLPRPRALLRAFFERALRLAMLQPFRVRTADERGIVT